MTRPDFVQVQLSKKGLEVAGGSPVRITAGHYDFEFTPGVPQEVTRGIEWAKVLEHQVRDGEPMFEVVGELAHEAEHEAEATTNIASEGKD